MKKHIKTRAELCSLYHDLLSTGLTIKMRVTGKSMGPFLKGNEVLSIRKASVSSLQVGDLIFFQDRSGMPILHRIVKKIRNGNGQISFCTKGDALLAPDDTVHAEEVMGRVCEIRTIDAHGETRSVNMESYLQRTVNFLKALISLGKADIYMLGSKYLSPASLRSVFKRVFL